MPAFSIEGTSKEIPLRGRICRGRKSTDAGISFWTGALYGVTDAAIASFGSIFQRFFLSGLWAGVCPEVHAGRVSMESSGEQSSKGLPECQSKAVLE